MPPRKAINPDQGAMFEQDRYRPKVEHVADVDQIIDPPTVPSTEIPELGQPGVSVDLAERAQYLTSALNVLAAMSRTAGLEQAANGRLRPELEARMDDVDMRVGRSLALQKDRERQVKHDFATAIGHHKAVESGLITEEAAKASARIDYQQFIDKYADAQGSQARTKYRDRITRNAADAKSHAQGFRVRDRKPRSAA